MPEMDSSSMLDSSEVAAIVCGVPVVISDSEPVCEIKEKKATILTGAYSEKGAASMELDISVDEKEIGISISESITKIKREIRPEKDCANMELDISENEKVVLPFSACKTVINDAKEKKNAEVDRMCCERDSSNMELDVSSCEKRKVDISGNKNEMRKVTIFYAVSLPTTLPESEVQPFVFTSKNDALAAIKKYPGTRFMQFTSYEDAVQYSIKPLPVYAFQASLEEKSSKYKSVSSQQMVALRKAIEKGDENTFLDTVWSNPRYLINNAGDGPTVMQEGTRYNALHVAARFKQSEMCLTILNTIQDPQFMSLLYPYENQQLVENRIERLIDLYLNTPDKSLSETPLHFACKFGAYEILSILLSYHQCDINKKNKYGLSPREMICDRTAFQPGLKEKMDLMFEDLFYVPVLRDLANNIQEPVIGKPCHVNILLASTSCELTFGKNHLIYCAFAGPMSEPAADNFYMLFKKRRFSEKLSFTPEEKKQLVDICLSDSEKGLERVGRKLAKELNVGWIEYWPVLQFWGDLSNEGLEFLERKLKSHLKPERSVSASSATLGRCESLAKDMVDFADDFIQKLPEILENKNKMTFFVLLQTLLPHTIYMAQFSFSNGKELHFIHQAVAHLLYMKLVSANKEGFENLRFYLNKQFHSLDGLLKSHTSRNWKMLICILKYLCYYPFCDIKSCKPPICDCSWNTQKKCSYSSYFVLKYISAESKAFLSKEMSCLTVNNNVYSVIDTSAATFIPSEKEKDSTILIPFQNLSLDITATNCKELVEQQNSPTLHFNPENVFDDVFYQPHKSLNVMQDVDNFVASNDKQVASKDYASGDYFMDDLSDESENFFTPPESPSFDKQEVFVKGITDLSDVDIDIFRAIVDGGARVNRNKHPYVFEWKCVMESKLKSLLKPSDKLSCTPASSSASLRRAVMPVERVRRTLF